MRTQQGNSHVGLAGGWEDTAALETIHPDVSYGAKHVFSRNRASHPEVSIQEK